MRWPVLGLFLAMTVPRVSKWKMKYLVFAVLGTEAFARPRAFDQ